MTRFVPVADHGLLVEFATEISQEASDAVMGLDRALAAAAIPGIVEVVPAFVNLLVLFDPLTLDHVSAQVAVESLLPTPEIDAGQTEVHEVPVCYDGSFGPDLEAIAAETAMSVEAVIAAHLAGDYRVGMYGFAPGYAYLSGTPQPLQLPRKTAVVPGVSAGSVIIAGAQCLVTTLEMPTGWWILGRSPTSVLTDDPDRPGLFDIGDQVRFTRIDAATYESMTTT